MYWNDLEGTELLSRVFSKPVKMSFINVFGFEIDQQGPTAIISFDLIDQLPDNPPLKWGKSYNRCRAGINCGGVKTLEIRGISTDMRSSIVINKTENGNDVTICGDIFYLKLSCLFISFIGPSVYMSCAPAQ